MKHLKNFVLLSIMISHIFVIVSTQSTSITFSKDDQILEIKDKKQFTITANYELETTYKYLYIYPKNPEENLNINKGLIRIYFKQNKGDNQDLNINYLNSDFSTIDFNSGLIIKIKDLQFRTATIFIFSYENFNLIIQYKYTNDIVFPSYFKYSNYQFNQFVLAKGAKEQITFKMVHSYNDYLIILSKTSLRNIEVQVTYEEKEANQMLSYLYPNGCSIFLDRSIINDNKIYLTIKNNNNRNEIVLLGYMHHREDQLFPNPITNGFQLYLEGNNNKLNNLVNPGNKKFEQYFTYQIFSKGLDIEFAYQESDYSINKEVHTISEYNSMFHYNIDFEGSMRFEFIKVPKRNSFYMQYLDFNDNIIAQKSLQPLVTGLPKSMIIPSGKSLYHFLPIERDSNNINYYLRPKTKEQIFVSFEKCSSYPDNCSFTGKVNNAVEAIENIGLWYTLPTNRSELQLIYIYCEKECAYDILMTYDDDPLYLFPENDYTKFIGDTGIDMLVLPVFEYFEKIKTQTLYIDLTVLSGKAEITLKNGRNGKVLDYKVTKIGKRQSYSITFSNSTDYFKKEIYAVVQQDKNYKNTIYNIMYGNGDSNNKILKNNIVNMELLIVPEINKEGEYTKVFTFINKNSKFYVSISTHTCKSIVEYNGKKSNQNNYFHQVFDKAGTYSFKIYLVRDEKYCTEGVEEEVILFAYNSDNSNVLLSENTLINSTISSKISFTHLFKPKNAVGVDNSFNIEIERLNKSSLLFNYQLKRVSFNGLYNRKLSDTLGQKIILNNYKYISNEQIRKICGSLRDYEVCSLTMTLIPDSSSEFSLQLRKNDFYYAKNMTAQTLIGSVNTKNAQYFYIDINQNNNIRLFVNSYGQDLNYKYEVIKEKKEDNDILPLKDEGYSEGLNFHQITILKKEFSNCNSFCRLYIGVKPSMGSSTREGSTRFSIGYQYYDEGNKFSDINIPLNYFSQYILNDSEEVNYILYPFEDGNFFFELYVIKKNESDDSEVAAYISGTQLLTSSVGKTKKAFNAGKIAVNIKITKGNNLTFKFRVSSIGQQQIVPIISSYEEKCLSDTCYYLLDDLSSEKLSFNNDDDIKKFVYFYIPEKESSTISYKLLKYNDSFSTSGTETFDNTSNDLMKRSNWLQIPIFYNEHSVIIKLENAKDLTLCSTNYNKPNAVTLNYGEQRIFSIQRKALDNITFYINNKDSNKIKIKLHAIKGNGIFIFNNEIYPLGFENAYKEDICIVISDVNNIKLIAINEKNGKADEYDDFVFTIEYKIELTKQFIYEINYDKINSFKFYNNKKINDIDFYLNYTGRENKDLNMNIKIYSDETIYSINSYFVDNEFIQQKLNDPKLQLEDYNSTGKIKTYIQGGNPKNNILTFSKLEISSDILKAQNNNKYTFIYINFKLKEYKDNFKVKIDLYPYNVDNIISPLARNQLFIQKIPSNVQNYKLFLSKSDIYYNEAVAIDYVFPLKSKYNYFITHTEKGNENPTQNEQGLIITKNAKVFGKDELIINIDNSLNKKKLSFNLIPENKDEFNEELFIFSYKNTKSVEGGEVYTVPTNLFEVKGNSKNLNYTLHAPASLLKGNTILIIRIYEQDDIKDLLKSNIYDIDDQEDKNEHYIHYYLPLYLLFSDIKPMFTKYEVLDKIDRFTSKWTTINKIKHGGDLYLTAICIVEDNEREIYFAYKGIKKNVKNAGFLQDLLDYIEDHIFASIIILIVIIMIFGMLINICRAERKSGRLSSVKVDVEGQLMEDKAD